MKSKKPSLLRLYTVLIVCGALLFERVAWILSSEGLHSYPAPCHLLYPLRRSSQARHLGLYSRCLFWEVRGICFWGSSSFSRAPLLSSSPLSSGGTFPCQSSPFEGKASFSSHLFLIWAQLTLTPSFPVLFPNSRSRSQNPI